MLEETAVTELEEEEEAEITTLLSVGPGDREGAITTSPWTMKDLGEVVVMIDKVTIVTVMVVMMEGEVEGMITVMVVRGITTREFLETTVVEEEAMTEEEVGTTPVQEVVMKTEEVMAITKAATTVHSLSRAVRAIMAYRVEAHRACIVTWGHLNHTTRLATRLRVTRTTDRDSIVTRTEEEGRGEGVTGVRSRGVVTETSLEMTTGTAGVTTTRVSSPREGVGRMSMKAHSIMESSMRGGITAEYTLLQVQKGIRSRGPEGGT